MPDRKHGHHALLGAAGRELGERNRPDRITAGPDGHRESEVFRMNILVCVKQVPDTTEIRIDPVTNTLIRAGVPSIDRKSVV